MMPQPESSATPAVPTLQMAAVAHGPDGPSVARRNFVKTHATPKAAAMHAQGYVLDGKSVILTLPGEPPRLYTPEWQDAPDERSRYRLQCPACKSWRLSARARSADSVCRVCYLKDDGAKKGTQRRRKPTTPTT